MTVKTGDLYRVKKPFYIKDNYFSGYKNNTLTEGMIIMVTKTKSIHTEWIGELVTVTKYGDKCITGELMSPVLHEYCEKLESNNNDNA